MLNTNKFILDKEGKTITGIFPPPKKTWIGAKFYSERFSQIKGFVFQLFQIDSYRGIKFTMFNSPVPEGYWVGSIKFEAGWEIIESEINIEFELIEFSSKQSEKLDKPKTKLGYSLEKFKKMNRPHELSSFDVDIRGGSTDGAGRNEHGEPHIHLLEKNTRKEIGKIEIPVISEWENTSQKLDLIKVLNGKITRNQIKELVNWLSQNENEKLKILHKEWDELNFFNNRTLIKMPLLNEARAFL